MILTGIAMVITIAGALLAATRRNVVHAVFGLAVALLGIALCFLALRSPFVAAMQVLIYIGGITIAMIFAVMLSATAGHEQRESAARRILGALVAVAFFAALAPVLVGANLGEPAQTADSAWKLGLIGEQLLNRFNVVFELLSVVLLLAIIGAIAVARHEHPEEPDPTSADKEGAA
ncbi:MAG: NADH-quinone oxidoreductase subunit J [Phycisphaeraceae bacterium]|nr:NADH-quinone oxidoreductase subunit J [Phycisphaeraceae bacterium]